jgi:YihY family inner membrane protein
MRRQREFLQKVQKDNILMLMAVVSWGVLMSVIPVVVALTAIVGIVLRDPQRQQQVILWLSQILQHTLTQSDLRDLVHNAIRHTGLLALVGGIGVLWGASTVGGAISTVFQPIFGVRGRPVVHEKIIDIAMIFVFTVLMLVILVATTAGALIVHLVSGLPFGGPATLVIGTVVSLFAAFLLFLTLYSVFPNIEPQFKRGHVWKGAGIAALLFQLLSYVWPLYATLFHPMRYGSLYAPIVVLAVWIYAFSAILVFGAEVVAWGSLLEAAEAGVPVGPAPDGTVPQRIVELRIERNVRRGAGGTEAGGNDQQDSEQGARIEYLVQEDETDESSDSGFEAHQDTENARRQGA